jgi:hypothetical protein
MNEILRVSAHHRRLENISLFISDSTPDVGEPSSSGIKFSSDDLKKVI